MNQTINKMSNMRLNSMAQIHHQRLVENLHQEYTVDEYTSMLVEQEWEQRQNNKIKRLISSARFKTHARITDIDFKTSRALDKDLINKLTLLNFVKKKHNIILTGPTGIGKSYLAQAIGNQACMQGYKTYYQNTARFISVLKFAKIEGSYLQQLKKMNKIQVLILDDFGLSKMDVKEREILMDIVEQRHETSSTIIASQIPISKWYDIIGEGTIADAILDRIINSAYRLELKGKSLRRNNIN